MKNYLIILSIIFTYGQTFCQVIQNDSIIDGSFIIAASCDVDTTINFYSNSKIEWCDSLGFERSHYRFSPGNKSYCEVTIKTKNCRCRDCSFTEIFIIPFESQSKSTMVVFDESNSFWIIRNVWRINSFEENFSGTLDFVNNQLTINPTLEGKPSFKLAGKIITNKLLTYPL